MSTDDLYDQAIVAEAKAKIGAGRLEAPAATAECDNPLCGDRITLDLDLADGRIAAIGHKTRGCLLTQAAASLLSRNAIDAEPRAAAELGAALRAFLAGADDPRFEILRPVRTVKSRHDCVTLPFQALDEALAGLKPPA